MSKILIDEDTVKLALEALEAGEYYIDDLEAIVYAADDLGTHEDRAKMQEAITALREAQAEQPEQQEPVAKMGMYEHKCPNVTGHRGPSFVCQKAGHGVGQNSYCKGCICPQALNTSQTAPVQQGWPSDCLVSEKAKQSGFDLSPMPNLLYTVRGNHAQLVNFARAMLAAAPQPAQQEPVAKVCHDLDGHIGWNPNLRQLPDEGAALYTSLPTLSLAQRPHECSRSHPHENMNAMCELRTEIARLTNENARLKAMHQNDEINTYRMTLLCIRDGLQQGMSKSIQKLQAREINDVLGLPSFASYRTSPPPQRTWVGLTHEEHMEIMMGTMTTSSRMAAVEAKLREKNT